MSPTKESKALTVLYVEDESMIRSNVESCLSHIFNLVVAKDGVEGINCFKNNKIDLIITDINMPIKDGIEMLEEIKKLNPNIPCIVTSAYDVEVVSKLKSFDIYEYMLKPFDIKELIIFSKKALNLP